MVAKFPKKKQHWPMLNIFAVPALLLLRVVVYCMCSKSQKM